MAQTATKILVDGNEHHVFKHDGIMDMLPVGVYEFRFGPMGKIYLEKQEEPSLPAKIYSNDKEFILHVNKSFSEMKQGLLGLALVGGKGLGKSFTANILAKNTGLPVIKLTNSVGDNSFLNYLNQLTQDFVLFIDEFEKIFPSQWDNNDKRASQEELLTYLDGGTERTNKILFVITSNSAVKISDFFKNRPSRLRYFKEYNELEGTIIKEVVSDLLNDKTFQKDLLENLPYEGLNLDALIKIIQEINTHSQPYSQFKSFFNFQTKDKISCIIYLKKEEGNELIGELTNAIWTDGRIGISKKINQNKDTPIYLRNEAIQEQPNSTFELEGYYYPPNDDEAEISVVLIIEPVSKTLYNHLAY